MSKRSFPLWFQILQYNRSSPDLRQAFKAFKLGCYLVCFSLHMALDWNNIIEARHNVRITCVSFYRYIGPDCFNREIRIFIEYELRKATEFSCP